MDTMYVPVSLPQRMAGSGLHLQPGSLASVPRGYPQEPIPDCYTAASLSASYRLLDPCRLLPHLKLGAPSMTCSSLGLHMPGKLSSLRMVKGPSTAPGGGGPA